MLTFSRILTLLWIIWVPLLWWYGIATESLYNWKFLWKAHINAFLWDISWYSVVFVIAIRPLADLFPKFRILRKLVILRKPLGILSASVVITAVAAKYIQNPHLISNYLNSTNWSLTYPILSRITEITALMLLITSNTFSQRHLKKWWKRIQKTSYIYFICGGLVAAQFWDVSIYYTIWVVLFLWLIAKLKIKIWR